MRVRGTTVANHNTTNTAVGMGCHCLERFGEFWQILNHSARKPHQSLKTYSTQQHIWWTYWNVFEIYVTFLIFEYPPPHCYTVKVQRMELLVKYDKSSPWRLHVYQIIVVGDQVSMCTICFLFQLAIHRWNESWIKLQLQVPTDPIYIHNIFIYYIYYIMYIICCLSNNVCLYFFGFSLLDLISHIWTLWLVWLVTMTKQQMMYDQISIPDCTHLLWRKTHCNLQLRHHAITVPPAVLHRNTAEGIMGGMCAKLPFMPRGGLWCGLVGQNLWWCWLWN